MANKDRHPPPSGVTDEATIELLDAIHDARFALHTALLRAVSEDDTMSLEFYGEVLAGFQHTLVRFYGDEPVPPICKGCSPLTIEQHGFNEKSSLEPHTDQS